MEPITTALIAALTAGAAKAAEKAIVDGYEVLKTALQKKFGKESELSQAVEKLEQKPDSAGRQETLKEEVAAARAEQDPELHSLAQSLLEALKAQPGGETHIQQATGSYIAQADRGGSASVNVNQPKE